jgi:hypothetical protein
MENNQLKHQQINLINFYFIDIYKINEIFNANFYLYLFFISIIIIFNFQTNT